MELSEQKCQGCEGGTTPLTAEAAQHYLTQLNAWAMSFDHRYISKTFYFKGFYKTMAFMNMVAFIANQENHHPDCEISYNKCVVHFTTHAISGLSENDFICAAKIDKLVGA